MSNELKPCPFCGDTNVTCREQWNTAGQFCGYVVCCWNCNIETWICHSEAEAIASWNTRAAVTDHDERDELIRDMARELRDLNDGGISTDCMEHERHARARNRGVMMGELTAEQVRKAIFSGSVYANYDGTQYYASGIDMQAIADELNADIGERMKRLEKLVRIYGEISNYFCERFACCDAEFANCKYCIGLPQGGQCELGWCNDESKALGIEQPDYGGGECEPVNLQELYDKLSEIEVELEELKRENAELHDENAELTHRRAELEAAMLDSECEYVVEDTMDDSVGMGGVWFRCTNCNNTYDYYADDWLMYQNYCPHCGFKIRKVVRA